MKFLLSLSVAAFLAFGLAGAQAEPADNSQAGFNAVVGQDFPDHPYHPCHGSASGTAHASCGTLTGGPSGGLF